jgi:hypothetical protein
VTSKFLPKIRLLVLSVSVPFALTLSFACSSSQTTVGLLSLQQSGRVSFLCVGPDRSGSPLEVCPRGPTYTNSSSSLTSTTASPDHSVFALVTQTASAEVALIRVSSRTTGQGAAVLDVDRTNPGVTPLRVGANPGEMASTPGGYATFIGVSEPGRPGLFALPTECLWGPGTDEYARDITTWPACSLPAAPGEMVVLLDAADDAGRVRPSCTASYEEVAFDETSLDKFDCKVHLAEEAVDRGRHKLVVALPSRGTLAVIDAQSLLDRPPGSYDPCPIESEVALRAAPGGAVSQPLPDDLAGLGCYSDSLEYPAPVGQFTTRPTSLAYADGTLFVGDEGAPVVHRLGARDVCQLTELDPLRPTSVTEPSRVVTTSRVRVSPETTEGKRFLYAIDNVPGRPASAMVFDVSSAASPVTPLVRPGSKEMPFEAPDRLEFAAAIKDIAFAKTDDPVVDPETNVGEFDLLCNPDPGASSTDPGIRYRPNEGLTSGAGVNRRGIFAYVLTSDSSLNVVDVEDFDAACRRPAQVNTSSEVDFRGCPSEPGSFAYLTESGQADGVPTVTDEFSCRVVEPHRARSRGKRGFFLTNESLGTGAPVLLSAPRLSLNGRVLPLSRSVAEGRRRPIMLGVDFGSGSKDTTPGYVYYGTTKRSQDSASTPLDIDPNTAELASLVLPFVEPRAYPTSETASIAYEGELDGIHNAGQLEVREDGSARFSDADAGYCDAGVQDLSTTSDILAGDFGLSGSLLKDLSERYSDYVQVVSPLPEEEDDYWQREGKACLDGAAFSGCDAVFGQSDADDLRRERDLKIRSAHQTYLDVVPVEDHGDPTRLMNEMLCCMPGPLSYRLRASEQWVVRGSISGVSHPVVPVQTAEGDFECRLACDPIRGQRRSRAFELTSTGCEDPSIDAPEPCGVGQRTIFDVICAFDATQGPVEPGGPAADCIYDNGIRRFAMYRGLDPSQRGMVFSFEVGGGFIIDGVNLTAVTNGARVLPTSLHALGSFGAIGVVDAADRGLMLLDVRSNSIMSQFY